MSDTVQVQVVFTVEEDDLLFTDALYVPLDEYDAMSKDGRLEVLKQERFDNWKTAITAPPPDVPVESPVSSVDQARQILTDALVQLDAIPQDVPATEG